MAVNAKAAIELINKGDFTSFSNEDLIELGKVLPSQGDEGKAAFAKVKAYLSDLFEQFADGSFRPSYKDVSLFGELIRVYGTDAEGKPLVYNGEKLSNIYDAYVEENLISEDLTAEKLNANDRKLETLEKKYNPHDAKSDLFKDVHETLQALDLTDAQRADILEAARLNTYTDVLISKQVNEEIYKSTLMSNLDLAVFSVACGDRLASMPKDDASKAAQYVRDQLDAVKAQGKGKVKVSPDAVMGFLTASMDRTEDVKSQIKSKFGQIPVVKKISDKLSFLDENFTKRYGNKYTKVRNAVKVASNISMPWLMIPALGFAGPTGLAVFGAYTAYNGFKPLIKSYKETRGNYNSFGAFMKDNKLNTMSAISGSLALGTGLWQSGSALLQTMNGNVTSEVTKQLFTYATTGRRTFAWATATLKNVVDIKAAYQEGKGKTAAWVKMGLTTAAFAFGPELAAKVSDFVVSDGNSAEVGKTDSGITLPDGRDLDASKVGGAEHIPVAEADSANVASDNSVQESDSVTVKKEVSAQATSVESEKAVSASRVVREEHVLSQEDCNGRIEAQARDHSLHTSFWDNRNRHFLGDEATKALYSLFEGENPALDLSKFEGIDNKEEFVYKYAIMRQNNLPEQRMLVELIEKACGGQLQEGDYIDIARGMNSYDNHGNPLCFTATSDSNIISHPHIEPCVEENCENENDNDNVQENNINSQDDRGSDDKEGDDSSKGLVPEAQDDHGSRKFYRGYIEEHATINNTVSQDEIKGRDYDYRDAPKPEAEAHQGRDYDTAHTEGEKVVEPQESQRITGVIDMANGGSVVYNFKDGAAIIEYSMPEDPKADELAKHLEGMTDEPEKMARKYTAHAEVYHDLHVRMEQGEVIPGAKEWCDFQEKHLGERGMYIDDEGYIHIDGNADRNELLKNLGREVPANGAEVSDKETKSAVKADTKASEPSVEQKRAMYQKARSTKSGWDY